MAFLAPLFFIGLAAVAVPIFVHLIQRERKDVIEFPSLMFLRKIPYQSVERRRVHNWWLLLLRMAAMALIVAGFSRPFLTQDPVAAAAAITGAREVVILLDRSASMGYGDHWAKAQAEARKVADGLSGEDRATLVLFDRGVEEAVRATSDSGRLDAAIGQATVSSNSTQYAAALRWTQSFLSRSDRPRREAYLISDFQKSGWGRQEEIHLPEGATITPVSVSELETSDLAVSSVGIQRASFSGQERVTITAGLTNRGPATIDKLPVKLEIDGRAVDSREVTIGPNASGSVVFDAVTVAESNMRGVVRAGSDKLPKDNDFYFVLSPSRPVSVLILQADGADRNSSLFLSTVLDLSKAPPFTTTVMPVSRVQASDFTGRSVIVLN
ncbi:MAG: BatA and WFA domain-containing protein, partial [Acidobacteriota bacterium]